MARSNIGIVFGILVASANLYADSTECNSSSDFSKYACAKEGDLAFSKGDYEAASEFWGKACAKGLNSSCRSSELAKSNPAKLEEELSGELKESSDSPGKQKSSIASFYQDCSSGLKSKAECMKAAKARIADKTQVDSGLSIFRLYCRKEDGDACFQLGGALVRQGKKELAAETYLQGCTLGHELSCTVLQRIQDDIKLSEQRAEKEEAESRRHREEKAKAKQLAADQEKEKMKVIMKSFKKMTGDDHDRECTTERDPYSNKIVTKCKNNED